MGLAGFQHFKRALDESRQRQVLAEIHDILNRAPLFRPTMPRTGRAFSVRMSNCGPLGWVSSKEGGYRYQASHPETGEDWPEIPDILVKIWERFAGYEHPPEACLVNWYAPGAKMGLHVDADEEDRAAPVLSVSLGDDAWFRLGGLKRRDPTQRMLLQSGDIVLLAGAARFAYHGIDRILAGTSDLLGEAGRVNLTLRRVRPAPA